jgi:hypothetical protein
MSQKAKAPDAGASSAGPTGSNRIVPPGSVSSIAAGVLARGGVDGLALLAPAERGLLDFSRHPFRLSFPDGSGLAVHSFALVLADDPLLEPVRPN